MNSPSVISELHLIDWLTVLSFVTGGMLALATAGWIASQYLSRQFSVTNNLIDTKIEKLELNILNKLEYHEKHDDQRFDSQDQRLDHLRNDLWEVRVRNAAIDANRLNSN